MWMVGRFIRVPHRYKAYYNRVGGRKRATPDGHYYFSFGNGSRGSEHAYGGYCMSAPGRIIRGSFTATESRVVLSQEVKVNTVVNGTERINHSIVKKSGNICSCVIFRDPIELNLCDVINFISRTTNTKITNAYVSILIELDLQSKNIFNLKNSFYI